MLTRRENARQLSAVRQMVSGLEDPPFSTHPERLPAVSAGQTFSRFQLARDLLTINRNVVPSC
jgi:hypothetical protein